MTQAIHPTALVNPNARIGRDVEIGPYALVEADVEIGDGCRLLPHAVLLRGTVLGAGCVVHPQAVLGGGPEEAAPREPARGQLRVGAGVTFREGCTVLRPTEPGTVTAIGQGGYFMTGVTIGPGARLGEHCILINAASIGPGAVLGDRVVLSTHVSVKAHCWIGRNVMAQANSVIGRHVPPFAMLARFEYVTGLNVVGLRRAPDLDDTDRHQIKQAHRIVYRQDRSLADALAELNRSDDWGRGARLYIEFLRQVHTAAAPHDLGLCPGLGEEEPAGE